ncbi:hypothetical protein TWF694_004332 [Orbilia ellipsospora]|uniref:Uncharacterized protein n=1 Tax=Orbilia ellipsospora TaxID=2528407 RepID=A0AAV9WXU5_9PEZI
MDNNKTQTTNNASDRGSAIRRWSPSASGGLDESSRQRPSVYPPIIPSASTEQLPTLSTRRREIGEIDESSHSIFAERATDTQQILTKTRKLSGYNGISIPEYMENLEIVSIGSALVMMRKTKEQTSNEKTDFGRLLEASRPVSETSRSSASAQAINTGLGIRTELSGPSTRITELAPMKAEFSRQLKRGDLPGLKNAINTVFQAAVHLDRISELDESQRAHRLCISGYMKEHEKTLINCVKYLEGEDGEPSRHTCCCTSHRVRMVLEAYYLYFLGERNGGETKALLGLYHELVESLVHAEKVVGQFHKEGGLQYFTGGLFSGSMASAEASGRPFLGYTTDRMELRMKLDRLYRILNRRVGILKIEKSSALDLLHACQRLETAQREKQACCTCNWGDWVGAYLAEFSDSNYPPL